MPAPSLTATTELEAVNLILATIGQAPVNTLEVTGIRDVSIARQRLHESSRSFQTRGWHFNTEYEVALALDVNGKVAPGADILSIAPSDRYVKAALRLDTATMRLYDLENHTFVWTQAYTWDTVKFLSFEELPQSARDYVAVMAARRFQAQNVGSVELNAYTQNDENALRAEFLRDEMQRAKTNLFSGPASANRIVHRRY